MDITPCRQKWKGTMTDRERFNNQMHYGKVDRCFNMEFGYWKQNFTLWQMFVDNHITKNEEADIFLISTKFMLSTVKHGFPLLLKTRSSVKPMIPSL